MHIINRCDFLFQLLHLTKAGIKRGITLLFVLMHKVYPQLAPQMLCVGY